MRETMLQRRFNSEKVSNICHDGCDGELVLIARIPTRDSPKAWKRSSSEIDRFPRDLNFRTRLKPKQRLQSRLESKASCIPKESSSDVEADRYIWKKMRLTSVGMMTYAKGFDATKKIVPWRKVEKEMVSGNL